MPSQTSRPLLSLFFLSFPVIATRVGDRVMRFTALVLPSPSSHSYGLLQTSYQTLLPPQSDPLPVSSEWTIILNRLPVSHPLTDSDLRSQPFLRVKGNSPLRIVRMLEGFICCCSLIYPPMWFILSGFNARLTRPAPLLPSFLSPPPFTSVTLCLFKRFSDSAVEVFVCTRTSFEYSDLG